MISSSILCLPLLLPAADSIEDLYARFGGGFSSTSTEDFQSPDSLSTDDDETLLLKQILLTFDPSVEFEGHSFHFALGEKMTDQLSFEWEVQYLSMDLDSFNPQANGLSVLGESGLFYNFFDSNPADPTDQGPGTFQIDGTSGTFSALALTANIHFEHQFKGTPFGCYGGIGAGFSKNEVQLTVSQKAWVGRLVDDDPEDDVADNSLGQEAPSSNSPVDIASSEEWDFCWHWRAGIEYEIDRKSTLYVGWRAADYGSADIQGTGPSLTADTIEFGFQQTF